MIPLSLRSRLHTRATPANLHDVRTDPSHSHGLQRLSALKGYLSRQDATIITASVATESSAWLAHAFFDGCFAVVGVFWSAAAASTALP